MRTTGIMLGLLLLTAGGPVGCGDESDPADPGAGVPPPDEPITIVDITGKEWDVSYAVRELGFLLENFRIGQGPESILPITDPEFYEPGDRDYPAPETYFKILGTTAGGDVRAYPITSPTGEPVTSLVIHEVVNDQADDLLFAAAY